MQQQTASDRLSNQTSYTRNVVSLFFPTNIVELNKPLTVYNHTINSTQ